MTVSTPAALKSDGYSIATPSAPLRAGAKERRRPRRRRRTTLFTPRQTTCGRRMISDSPTKPPRTPRVDQARTPPPDSASRNCHIRHAIRNRDTPTHASLHCPKPRCLSSRHRAKRPRKEKCRSLRNPNGTPSRGRQTRQPRRRAPALLKVQCRAQRPRSAATALEPARPPS
jgi:hypothetical protein